MENLRVKKCVPCEGGIPPLKDDKIAEFLTQVPQWRVVPVTNTKGKTVNTIQRSVKFKTFVDGIAFINDVAGLAEAEGHHPNFNVQYNQIDFTLWTHVIGGLHENDFILAAKINDLIAQHAGT